MGIVADVPGWVNDWEAWLGLLLTILSIVGIVYTFTRFILKAIDKMFDDKLDDKVPGLINTAIEPIRIEQQRVSDNLAQHMVHETELIDQQNAVLEQHASEDQRRFEHIDEHFETIDGKLVEITERDNAARDDRKLMLLMLQNIQSDGPPHTPNTQPDPVQ